MRAAWDEVNRCSEQSAVAFEELTATEPTTWAGLTVYLELIAMYCSTEAGNDTANLLHDELLPRFAKTAAKILAA